MGNADIKYKSEFNQVLRADLKVRPRSITWEKWPARVRPVLQNIVNASLDHAFLCAPN